MVLLNRDDPVKEEEGVRQEVFHLEYRNGSDGWGLYVVRSELLAESVDLLEHADYVEISETPASKAGRETKLLAVSRIEDLIAEIARNAERKLK